MKLGILQCGSVLAKFQAEFNDYPAMFQRWLSNTSRPITFNSYAVNLGHYPTHIDECDAYITTGSHESVYDDQVWISDFQSFLLTLHQQQKKFIGICFGHQLVAQTLGGKTEVATGGWGVGVKTSQVLQRPNWMQPQIDELNLLVSHQDLVTQLPAEATLLATSDYCPNTAFTVAEHMLCFQGHPEFNKPYAKALMRYRSDVLGERIFNEGLNSLQLPTHEEVVAQWVINFLNKS